jgi:hypothetical protein
MFKSTIKKVKEAINRSTSRRSHQSNGSWGKASSHDTELRLLGSHDECAESANFSRATVNLESTEGSHDGNEHESPNVEQHFGDHEPEPSNE